MKKAVAVIGAQYGDEGKGLMTDALAKKLGNAIVVRSNGGSQAGHTVYTPDNKHHVFSHIGSGTFAGGRTHLSRFMVCNPIKFNMEYDKLSFLSPQVSVDPNAMVTIPMDVFVNQGAEINRGNSRHGSCGHGIGETVERNEHAMGFPITVGELRDMTVGKLIEVKNAWLDRRVKALGFDRLPEFVLEMINDENIAQVFIDNSQLFLGRVSIRSDADIASMGNVIFEAAQGLALDAERGAFPYVTRSRTGITNISQLSKIAGIEDMTAHYMTRCYTTRHGAGPLGREHVIHLPQVLIDDETNVPNQWQGKLRVAPLNIDFLKKNIEDDIQDADFVKFRSVLGVTCLDQVVASEELYMINNDLPATLPAGAVPKLLSSILNMDTVESWGRTRDNIIY